MKKTLALLTALVAGVVLAGCGGGSDEPGPTVAEPATSAAATTETVPAETAETGTAATETTETETATTETATAETDAPATSAGVEAAIEIVDGQPKGGVQELEAKKGDTVHIEVKADAPQELHLHGYDIEREVAPGSPAVFDFRAEFDGIYELETHLDDALLARLTVQP